MDRLFDVGEPDAKPVKLDALGWGQVYSPGGRSWRGSALCIPAGMPEGTARKLHSARGGPYVFRPFWSDPPPAFWSSNAMRLVAEYRCNMCTLAGLLKPGPWQATDPDGNLWARCGGNGVLIPLSRFDELKTWTVTYEEGLDEEAGPIGDGRGCPTCGPECVKVSSLTWLCDPSPWNRTSADRATQIDQTFHAGK